MMATDLRWETFPLVLAFALGGQLAHADIYTWVDASGATNVSNLSPPEGVRVTRVTHENPQKPVRLETARDAAHDAEIQALSERVQQLQREVDLARTYASDRSPGTPVINRSNVFSRARARVRNAASSSCRISTRMPRSARSA